MPHGTCPNNVLINQTPPTGLAYDVREVEDRYFTIGVVRKNIGTDNEHALSSSFQ